MKILLIIPNGGINKLTLGSFSRSMREAPLTLTTLAALTPSGVELKLIDENVEIVPLDFQADIVGISALTGTAFRAYELATHFRNMGATVVLGGVHPTIMPEEAAHYADVVFVGNAEKTWPAFLGDFAGGKHKQLYKDFSTPFNSEKTPEPIRNLHSSIRYNIPNTINATRGCMGKCEFCSVPAFTKGYQKRKVSDVIEEIATLNTKNFAFNDVSLVDDVAYAKELFTAMIPLKKQWGGLASIRVAKDIELVELMRKSGCRFLLIGLESINQQALGEINKNFNINTDYKASINLLHANKISVQGCFIFGFDHDDKSVFEATVQRVEELKIDIPRYAILTPYPGTKLYKRLNDSGRILSRDWSNYDTRHVVFQPAQMTPTDLYQGYCDAYRRTFSWRSSIKRTMTSPHPVITLFGNIAYRIHNRSIRKNALSPNHLNMENKDSLNMHYSTITQPEKDVVKGEM